MSETAKRKKPPDINPDAPGILRFNPLFSLFGWEVWWKYEYVGSVLTRSETYWKRVKRKTIKRIQKGSSDHASKIEKTT